MSHSPATCANSPSVTSPSTTKSAGSSPNAPTSPGPPPSNDRDPTRSPAGSVAPRGPHPPLQSSGPCTCRPSVSCSSQGHPSSSTCPRTSLSCSGQLRSRAFGPHTSSTRTLVAQSGGSDETWAPRMRPPLKPRVMPPGSVATPQSTMKASPRASSPTSMAESRVQPSRSSFSSTRSGSGKRCSAAHLQRRSGPRTCASSGGSEASAAQDSTLRKSRLVSVASASEGSAPQCSNEAPPPTATSGAVRSAPHCEASRSQPMRRGSVVRPDLRASRLPATSRPGGSDVSDVSDEPHMLRLSSTITVPVAPSLPSSAAIPRAVASGNSNTLSYSASRCVSGSPSPSHSPSAVLSVSPMVLVPSDVCTTSCRSSSGLGAKANRHSAPRTSQRHSASSSAASASPLKCSRSHSR